MDIPKLDDEDLLALTEISQEDINEAIAAWIDEFGETEYELLIEAD